MTRWFVIALLLTSLCLAAPAPASTPPATRRADVMADLVAPDARVKELAGGMKFLEGPAWMDGGMKNSELSIQSQGALVFSDINTNHMFRWDAADGVKIFRADSHAANGNTVDRRGRLITCEQTTRRVVRADRDGKTSVLTDRFLRTEKFNSPNDVIVKSDGTIWFSDPTYGLPAGEKAEIGAKYVFCLVPDVQLEGGRQMLANVTRDGDFDQPNGLCFSPDESKLYISDSGRPHHIMVYDVEPVAPDKISLIPWRLSNRREFAVIDKGVPDGMRCDEHGNVWSSAGDGVDIFSPDGKLIGKIPVPQTPANLCFGGSDGKTVFITARTGLYCIRALVKGAPRPEAKP